MTNLLVASPVDTATPLSGTGLLESGSHLAAAIESGNWIEGSLAGVGTALDTAATVIDPLGSLIGAGLGWLIDHLEPLEGWFNDFTGDAGEVAGFSQTWSNIQGQLQTAGDDLGRVVSDVDDLAGEALEAYRRFQREASQHLGGAASWAGAMSTGLQIASTIVQAVHDLVRDVLSQLVGSIIAWAVEAVFTLGLATPVIVGQVATKVAAWTAKVGKTVIEAVSSCRALAGLLDELTGLLRQAGALFDGVLRGSSARATGNEAPSAPVRVATPEEMEADLEALRHYTGDGHEAINAALRGEIDMTPELRAQIDAAVRALDRIPDHVGTVWRGEYAEPGARYLDAYVPGEVMSHPSFTSADIDSPFPGNVQYQIESAHGKHVRDISQHAATENEVLFRPDARFLVESRQVVGGITYISLRELS